MSRLPARTSRYAAIETLVRLQRTRFPVKPLLDTVIAENTLPAPERRLAMTLVFGVLRQRQYLDLLIEKLCSRGIDKLDSVVYAALSIGLFQIFCLDRIPESAAVNETVNGVKAAKLKKHLQGFVNGVLRSAIRKKADLPALDEAGSDTHPLLNHPAWLTGRWEKQFGREEMERICRVNNLEPQLVLRVNTRKISVTALSESFAAAAIANHPGQYAPESLVLPEYHGSITSLPGFAEGYFQIQDEAAQLATLLLQPFVKHGRYLDACAGLGGKTSHILQLTEEGEGHVVAVEPEAKRQRLLQENVCRLFSQPNLTLVKSNIQTYCRTNRLQYQGVLVDAPCSGTGVTGRHPDIRWNRQEKDLIRYQHEQLDILEHAAGLVAADGLLVYATCSLEPEENRQVIDKFLEKNDDFSLTNAAEVLPASCLRFMDEGCFNPHPHSSIDGFFAARLQKNK